METIVNINGEEVTLKSVGTLPKVYKMYFQRDFFEDLNILKDFEQIIKMLKGEAELNVFENVAWVMAKTANHKLPNLERWKSSFEVFAIKDIIEDIQNILALTIGATSKEVSKAKSNTSTKSINTEMYLVLCKECGLQNDDLETMTIGMVLDYIDEYLKTKNPDKKPKVLEASQAHFNSF